MCTEGKPLVKMQGTEFITEFGSSFSVPLDIMESSKSRCGRIYQS